MSSPDFIALTRLVTVDGNEQLEGIVVDGRADEVIPEPWDAHRPVDRWVTTAHDPEGRHGRAQRVDLLLAELGWQRADAVVRPEGAPFPVARLREVFRAQVVETDDGPAVAVLLHTGGDLVTELPLVNGDLRATLERQGWRTLRRLDDWAGQPWLVTPYDWDVVLGHASATQRAERARAEAAQHRWQLLVREAVRSGVPGNRVAAATGVSPQRINQLAKRTRA